MIPKIVHYVWFGDKPYPKRIRKCIDSWHRILPDYTFIKWDETNFDVNSSLFAKQAYEKKQWAFVSDYVRIKALYEQGGWYLDTDVEVIKPLAPFEKDRVVLGTDENGSLTAVYGSEPMNELWYDVLSVYNNTNFIKNDGSFNIQVVNLYIENVIYSKGYVRENKYQRLNDGIVVYPDDYFHVASLESGEKHFTDNSTCIHWQTMLWTPRFSRFLRWVRLNIIKRVGGEYLLNIYSRIARNIKRVH